MVEKFSFIQIGTIKTPHLEADKTPIQPTFAVDCRGEVLVFPEFAEGLRDIEGFSHIFLIYAFHKVATSKLIVKPFLEDIEHGVFATRAPCRPNPIGISVVRLLGKRENVLEISGADMLDGTPLLDIKPYTALFDKIEGTKNGWQDGLDPKKSMKIGSRR